MITKTKTENGRTYCVKFEKTENGESTALSIKGYAGLPGQGVDTKEPVFINTYNRNGQSITDEVSIFLSYEESVRLKEFLEQIIKYTNSLLNT
jgi:hypothetical protein